MKDEKPKRVMTVKFEVFEKDGGKTFSTILTKPAGLLGFAAITLLESHISDLKVGRKKEGE